MVAKLSSFQQCNYTKFFPSLGRKSTSFSFDTKSAAKQPQAGKKSQRRRKKRTHNTKLKWNETSSHSKGNTIGLGGSVWGNWATLTTEERRKRSRLICSRLIVFADKFAAQWNESFAHFFLFQRKTWIATTLEGGDGCWENSSGCEKIYAWKSFWVFFFLWKVLKVKGEIVCKQLPFRLLE